VRRVEEEASGPLVPIADDDWELQEDDAEVSNGLDEGRGLNVDHRQGASVPEVNGNENDVDPFQYSPQPLCPPQLLPRCIQTLQCTYCICWSSGCTHNSIYRSVPVVHF